MNIRNPAYLPLVDACKAHGISRSVAYELARDGTLETFLIGKRRYVRMSSLRTLPQRISESAGKHRDRP